RRQERAALPSTGGRASGLAVEPLTGPVDTSCHPRSGTRLFSGSASPGAGKTAGQGLFIVRSMVDWGHGGMREVRGATDDRRARPHAAVLLAPLPRRRTPGSPSPAA